MSPKASNTSPRPIAPINSKLEKNLTTYIAAAGAAGVGLLALAQSAQAKVVYTSTNVYVTTPLAIDLNHDGITDFTIGFAQYSHDRLLGVTPNVPGNAVRGNSVAACGFFGVPVGPGEKFTAANSYWGHGVRMASRYAYGVSQSYGPWANVTNRYLGFKFLINGEVHYGWARVSVSDYLYTVLLTGYAYETTPNKNIIEGHTFGPERAGYLAPSDLLVPSSQPASLGMLARGADALALWRRDDEVLTQQK